MHGQTTLKFSQKCVLWPILKANDRHISSMYLRPHAKCVCVVVVVVDDVVDVDFDDVVVVDVVVDVVDVVVVQF